MVALVVRGCGGQGEWSLYFVAGESDEFGGGGVLVGADDGQEGVGERREGDPAQPGGVAADLVLFQAGEALAGLEGLLDLRVLSGSG
ncbi:hypothetical protein [Streptomyces sp. NBC_00989]|uniref:hypothetical protein n=1 Tax=Streptomyces sp. NBC_00989 TaxID=2903705 RepID=UPI00386D9B4B|nr:hypothetical protein OG714_00590 [Streptomyces sp. NBC_00989]WSW98720.1 hypothetical protein OG714_53550 [Streptomyces sp. NBC_00989]